MQLVGVVLAGRSHDVELHRQVIAGVHLLEHRQRRHLRIAQVGLGVGAMDAPRQRLLLVAFHPHALALLAEHQRRAGILAHRQHAARRDVGVLQQIQRDEPIVATRLRVVEDRAQGRQMPGTQQVRHIAERLERQLAQRVRCNAQHRLPIARRGPDATDWQPLPRRLARAQRKHRGNRQSPRASASARSSQAPSIPSTGSGGGTHPG